MRMISVFHGLLFLSFMEYGVGGEHFIMCGFIFTFAHTHTQIEVVKEMFNLIWARR